jgi:hypothetical protein
MDYTVTLAAKAFWRVVFNILIGSELTSPLAAVELARRVFPKSVLGVQCNLDKSDLQLARFTVRVS